MRSKSRSCTPTRARARDIPFDSLPAAYVVRPVLGFHGVGTFVMSSDTDLLHGQRWTTDALVETLSAGRGGHGPYLVEQVVRRADGHDRLPIQYKCHTFGSYVAAIEVDRQPSTWTTTRWYTPEWHAIDEVMFEGDAVLPPSDTPPFLDDLVASAARLGAAVGTYMRIDFFGGEDGAVFNEFSSQPVIDKPSYSPYCRQWFGELWADLLGNAV